MWQLRIEIKIYVPDGWSLSVMYATLTSKASNGNFADIFRVFWLRNQNILSIWLSCVIAARQSVAFVVVSFYLSPSRNETRDFWDSRSAHDDRGSTENRRNHFSLLHLRKKNILFGAFRGDSLWRWNSFSVSRLGGNCINATHRQTQVYRRRTSSWLQSTLKTLRNSPHSASCYIYCQKLEISSPQILHRKKQGTWSSPGGETGKAVQCFLFRTISFRLNLLLLVINCKYLRKRNKIINNMDIHIMRGWDPENLYLGVFAKLLGGFEDILNRGLKWILSFAQKEFSSLRKIPFNNFRTSYQFLN